MPESAQQLHTILLQLLLTDHTTVGNITLWGQFQAAVKAAGISQVSENTFKAAREALVASGQAIKGKGRGGSTARATGPNRPGFDLQVEPATPDLMATLPNEAPPAEATAEKPSKPAKPKATLQATPPGDLQVMACRHGDRRKNNPEFGLVSEVSDPQQAKTHWAYDPHLDPALQFDSARSDAERLIEDALAGDESAAMRHAVEELRRMSAPYLQWTGKAERTSFEVDTVSQHVHERIDAMSILSAVSKPQCAMQIRAASAVSKRAAGQKVINYSQGFQPGLFEAPFESMPLRSAIDFYKHDRGWARG